MRNVLSIHVAMLLTLGMNAIGCSSSDQEAGKTRDAVLRVLKQDEELAKALKSGNADEDRAQFVAKISQYITNLEPVEMSDCPADFRVAYRQHIRAWGDCLSTIKRLPDGLLDGALTGLMNSILHGEIDGGARRIEGEFQKVQGRVKSTWEEAERIAAKYGAAL